MGAPNRECLVMDCAADELYVTVAWAESDVAVQETDIPFDASASCAGAAAGQSPGVCLLVEAIDSMYDRL